MRFTPQRPARSDALIQYGAAAVGVAAITALIHAVPGASHIASIPMLYLLVVIGTALGCGRNSAIAASILAFLAFDWFFTEPYHTLTVEDPAEWLALAMFLLIAVVTGTLTALLQARANEARLREREAMVLAETSWAVASQVDRDHALSEILRRIGDMVEPEAAAILAADDAGGMIVAARLERRPGQLPPFQPGPAVDAARFVIERGSAISWGSESPHWEKALAQAEHPDASYLPLTTDSRVLGVLYLRLSGERPVSPEARRIVESLANHAAVVLERDRLTRTETHALALEEADRLKTALLSMVSHDFRSPLASIKASASALLQDGAPLTAETQKELLGGIDQSVDRLNRVVGNLLALSRLEADAWRPQVEPTLPAELIGSALGALSAEQNRRVQVRIDPEVGEVSLDAVQLGQVLLNLVDNALKYSPVATTVEVAARREAGRFVLEVLDRGPGLAPGDEERVFERFYRAPDFRESAVPGVGIGLAVCRGLVEAHGGSLTAHQREGGGSVFRIDLPY